MKSWKLNQEGNLFRLYSVQRTHFRERGPLTHPALKVCFTKIPVVAGDRCNVYYAKSVLLLTQGQI